MFRSVKRRVLRYVLASAALFAVATSWVSWALVSKSMLHAFQASAQAAVAQSVARAILSIDSAKAAAVQIVRDQNVLQALASAQFNPAVAPILNTLKNTSFGVIGLTLYTPEHTYVTSNLSAVPTLAEMLTHPDLQTFAASGDETFLSLRTSHMAGVYNHVRYDPAYGMLTYIVALADGYLFMDINPQFLYQNFFDYSHSPTLRGTETFLVTSAGEHLKSPRPTRLGTYLNAYLDKRLGAYHDTQLGAYLDAQLGAYHNTQLGAYHNTQLGAYHDTQLGAYHNTQLDAYPDTYLHRVAYLDAFHGADLDEADTGVPTITPDGRYLLLRNAFSPPGSHVVSIVPLDAYHQRMRQFAAALIVCTLASLGIAWAVGHRLGDGIVLPLTRLRRKMQHWSVGS